VCVKCPTAAWLLYTGAVYICMYILYVCIHEHAPCFFAYVSNLTLMYAQIFPGTAKMLEDENTQKCN
jgi:hypothetical protein